MISHAIFLGGSDSYDSYSMMTIRNQRHYLRNKVGVAQQNEMYKKVLKFTHKENTSTWVHTSNYILLS